MTEVNSNYFRKVHPTLLNLQFLTESEQCRTFHILSLQTLCEASRRILGLVKTIRALIVSITKCSIVIGSPRAYLIRNWRVITWVPNYSCPI